MKLKKWIMVALAAVVACSAGACAGSDAGKTKLYVNIFMAGFGDAWLKETALAFEATHPDVKVVPDANVNMDSIIKNRLTAGQYEKAGDIFTFTQQSFFQDMIRAGHIQDLTSYYDEEVEDGKTMRDIVEPNFLPFVTVNEKIYGVPWEGAVTGFAYNVKMFKKHGWQIPETMDAFYELCRQINEDEPEVAPLVYMGSMSAYWSNVLMSWMSSYEGKAGSDTFFALESENIFKAEGRLKAYEELAKIMHDSTIVHEDSKTSDHLAAQSLFLKGDAAMVLTGSWLKTEMSAYLAELPGFEIGMFTAPMLGGGLDKSGQPARLVNTGNCDMLAINSHSKNKELALEFLTFMHTQEMLEVYVDKTGGNPRPFKFERTDWSEYGVWTESLMKVWQTSDNIFPYSDAGIFATGELGFWPGKGGTPWDSIRDCSNLRAALAMAEECWNADYTEAKRRFEFYNKNH